MLPPGVVIGSARSLDALDGNQRLTLRVFFKSASYDRWTAKQSWDKIMNKMKSNFL